MSAKNRARREANAAVSKEARRAEREFEMLVARKNLELEAYAEPVSRAGRQATLAVVALVLFVLAGLTIVAGLS